MNEAPDSTVSTRSSVLEAGRRLFARRGYDGASIRAITREAGVNLGAVTYHFGSKQALYEAVLQRVLSPMGARMEEAAATREDPLDRVGAVIRAAFDHLEENPDMPQLMLQEMAAGKEPPAPVLALLAVVRSVLADAIRAGQAQGAVRPGIPELMAVSSVIQPVHLTLVRRWLESVLGIDMSRPEAREKVVEHAVEFVHAALRKTEEAR